MQYHVNGDLVPAEEATVSVEDRGFLYGDAAFETLRAYGGHVFAWEAHHERLERTCETLGMPDAVPGDLRERIQETLAANDLDEAYVRVSVTRGKQPGKLTPQPDVEPTVVIIVKELPRGGSEGEDVWETPATLQTVATRRVPDDAIPADIKTHNYLNGVLARLELRRTATEDGQADEALMRDAEGKITEGATSNVFFVDEEGLKTPATTGPLLPGVTRDVVLELAEDEAIPVETGKYTPGDLRDAKEAFLTNSTWELRPVASVDNVPVGGGPVTALLARRYDDRVDDVCYRKA